MKIFIYLLIVSNGFSVFLAYDDMCELNDLNALMIRLRQLKTEFHNLKVENDKQMITNKEEISSQLRTEVHNLTSEYDKQININKEEISHLKGVNENLKTEMLEYNQQINASKEEISHLKEVNENLATEMLEYGKQINASKEEISHLKEINGKQVKDLLELKKEFSNKSQEIESIKGFFSTRVPAFVVHLKEEVNYNCTNTIPFGTILLNVGDAYDNTTHHFKAPLAGLYMFTSQICSSNSYYHSLLFSIFSYTNIKTYGVSHYGQHAYCSSLTTLANLTANEEVYVQCQCLGSEIVIDQRTMFTGTLLSPEL